MQEIQHMWFCLGKLKLIKYVVTLLTTYFIISITIAQNKVVQFGTPKLSYEIGILLYEKATINPIKGVYKPTTKPNITYRFGFNYILWSTTKWKAHSGLYLINDPLYNFATRINQNDLYSHYNSDIENHFRELLGWSISAPILVEYNLRVSQNTYVNFHTGLRGFYFPNTSGEATVLINNEDYTEHREIFGLRIESSDQLFYGSFIVGTGIRFVQKKYTYGFNLFYVHNFQNLYEGEYLYGNLMHSGESRGKYYHSGNHFGLTFCIGKNKKRVKQTN